MPKGVIAEVVDGFATIDFVNPALRGPGLNRLLATGAPVQTLTREGPRKRYRVPEGNAAEAGLLDGTGSLTRGDTGYSEALVNADQEQRDEPNRPVAGSGSEFFVGTTTFDEARDTAHVPSTLVEGSGWGQTHPPTHDDVIRKVADAAGTRPVLEGQAPTPVSLLGPQREVRYATPDDMPTFRGPVEQADEPDLPDGDPDDSWKRDELDAYARRLGIENAPDLQNKGEVLKAIRKAERRKA